MKKLLIALVITLISVSVSAESLRVGGTLFDDKDFFANTRVRYVACHPSSNEATIMVDFHVRNYKTNAFAIRVKSGDSLRTSQDKEIPEFIIENIKDCTLTYSLK